MRLLLGWLWCAIVWWHLNQLQLSMYTWISLSLVYGGPGPLMYLVYAHFFCHESYHFAIMWYKLHSSVYACVCNLFVFSLSLPPPPETKAILWEKQLSWRSWTPWVRWCCTIRFRGIQGSMPKHWKSERCYVSPIIFFQYMYIPWYRTPWYIYMYIIYTYIYNCFFNSTFSTTTVLVKLTVVAMSWESSYCDISTDLGFWQYRLLILKKIVFGK